MWTVLAVGLVLIAAAIGGGATAGALITGKQIKNNSVTGKDVKNGSLAVADLGQSQVAQLHGADGEDGLSGFGPPPSGTVITGGGLASGPAASAGDVIRGYSSLSFQPAVPLTDATVHVYFGTPSASCTGPAGAPVPAAGQLCVGLVDFQNQAGVFAFAGASQQPDVDPRGFNVVVTSSGAGAVLVTYVWAYRAP
jgi:hypothetical protein